MKKLLISNCRECVHFYDAEHDPWPEVGWSCNKCRKTQKLLTNEEIKTIPTWCPLEDA